MITDLLFTLKQPCSWPEFNSIHPFVPKNQVKGYLRMFDELANDLCEITGYDKISFQPNRFVLAPHLKSFRGSYLHDSFFFNFKAVLKVNMLV
jgi:hypothetical protein